MTSNWKEFIEFVIKKFGSLSNFSQAATGSFKAFQGLQHVKNYDRIDWLHKKAKSLNFKIEDVEITDFDRKVIKARMFYFIFKEGYKNASAILREKGISHVYYSAVIHGRIKRKNLAFENLWKKLGL